MEMDRELIRGKTIEEIDDLIDEYFITFGEDPIVIYPQSLYGEKYVRLMEIALKRGRPYTEEELGIDYETTTI